MNQRPPPLWLLCDLVAWARVLLSGWSLLNAWRAARSRMVDARPRRLAPDDFTQLSHLLAEAEADLAWAIARQVRRLSGLPPGAAVRVVPTPPRSQWALIIRFRAQMRRAVECADAPARMAHRAMQRLMQAPAQPVADFACADPRAWFIAGYGVRRGVTQPRAPPAAPVLLNSV